MPGRGLTFYILKNSKFVIFFEKDILYSFVAVLFYNSDHQNQAKDIHTPNQRLKTKRLNYIFDYKMAATQANKLLQGSNNNLSEYEKLRAKNIERNNRRMVELGLMSEEESMLSNRKAWGQMIGNNLTYGILKVNNNLKSVPKSSKEVLNDDIVGGLKSKGLVGGGWKNTSKSIKKSKGSEGGAITRSRNDNINYKKKNTLFKRKWSKEQKQLVQHQGSTRKSKRKNRRKPLDMDGFWI